MFRIVRIALLLLVLATVAQEAWLARARATAWKHSLQVAIYPIDGDGRPATGAYVRSLREEDFRSIERFFDEEAKRYGREVYKPVAVALAPPIESRPPAPPENGSALDALIWSLKMRWWASRNDRIDGPKPNIRLFVLYFDPAENDRLPHSVGLKTGLIGRVNAFATPRMASQNAVVIAHELLHTLGATDKYDRATNLPAYPDGYADPGRNPPYPQEYAELMAGRVPVSETEAGIPISLDQTLIGPKTAAEIRWSGD